MEGWERGVILSWCLSSFTHENKHCDVRSSNPRGNGGITLSVILTLLGFLTVGVPTMSGVLRVVSSSSDSNFTDCNGDKEWRNDSSNCSFPPLPHYLSLTVASLTHLILG